MVMRACVGRMLRHASCPTAVVTLDFPPLGGTLHRTRMAVTMALSLSLSLASATEASAQYAFVSSRGAIGGAGLINWSTMGLPFTVLPHPFVVNVTGTPLTASVSQVGPASLSVRQQPSSWFGNFSPGDPVLFASDGPLDILFSGSVAAAGAQFQANYGAFTARIEAYDVLGNLLAGFDFAGLSTNANDGSAVFAGIASASGDIRRIRFSGLTATTNPNFFGINNLSVNANASIVSLTAPEPGTYLLTATGLLFVAVAVARRGSRRAATAAGVA